MCPASRADAYPVSSPSSVRAKPAYKQPAARWAAAATSAGGGAAAVAQGARSRSGSACWPCDHQRHACCCGGGTCMPLALAESAGSGKQGSWLSTLPGWCALATSTSAGIAAAAAGAAAAFCCSASGTAGLAGGATDGAPGTASAGDAACTLTAAGGPTQAHPLPEADSDNACHARGLKSAWLLRSTVRGSRPSAGGSPAPAAKAARAAAPCWASDMACTARMVPAMIWFRGSTLREGGRVDMHGWC